MKKICITFLVLSIIFLTAIGLTLPKKPTTEYLRIHVRANSNDYSEQAVKYAVKEAVVSHLTPFIAECDCKADAIKMLDEQIYNLQAIGDNVLAQNGFSYTCKVSVKKENFPTRVYDGNTLPAGVYDALIIQLGKGEGDNWWCVVYPPLCFTGEGAHPVYKSKIAQIIKNFFE